MQAVAVKALVIDSSQNTVSSVIGAPVCDVRLAEGAS